MQKNEKKKSSVANRQRWKLGAPLAIAFFISLLYSHLFIVALVLSLFFIWALHRGVEEWCSLFSFSSRRTCFLSSLFSVDLCCLVLAQIFFSAMHFFLPLSLFFSLLLILFSPRDSAPSLSSLTCEILPLFFLLLPFSLFFDLLFSPSVPRRHLIYLFLVIKSMDLGGYLGGKRFGRRPIAPQISPKKTWEGFLGGACLALVTHLCLYRGIHFALPPLFFFFLFITFAHWGDLTISLFKRAAGVKESGTIPGLGGVLDVVDSSLLALPLFYFYAS